MGRPRPQEAFRVTVLHVPIAQPHHRRDMLGIGKPVHRRNIAVRAGNACINRRHRARVHTFGDKEFDRTSGFDNGIETMLTIEQVAVRCHDDRLAIQHPLVAHHIVGVPIH